MNLKAALIAGMAAFALGTVALPAAAHCKCECEQTSHHKAKCHTVKSHKTTKVKKTKAKVKAAKVKTIVKVKTVVVEKPVIVEKVVYRTAPPPQPSPVVYVGGVWCKKTVKVTYRRESTSGSYGRSQRHYEGWRAERGDYGRSHQVAYNDGW